MADLEAATDTALAKVKELSGHVEEAKEACSDLREEVGRLKEELSADWEALQEKAGSLLDSVPEQRSGLDAKAQEATSAVAGLSGAVANAGAEGEQRLQAGAVQLTGLGEGIEGLRPQVAAMLEQAQAGLRSLAEQAAEMQDALEQAVSEAREFVGEESRGQLEAMKEHVTDWADEVGRALAEESTSALEEAYSKWESKLGEVEGFVEKAFQDAAQHAEDVVTYSLKECAKGHNEAIDELAQVLDATLAPALEKLEAAVELSTTEVEGSEGALEADMDEAGRELEAALSALQHVKELLASYSFVSL